MQQREANLPGNFAVSITENTIFRFSGVNRIALQASSGSRVNATVENLNRMLQFHGFRGE
jgi:hypothetical protein